MKNVVTKHFCDKCGEEVQRECGMVIEDLSAMVSGYDPRGSGGRKVQSLEFCYSCSAVLHSALGLDKDSKNARRKMASAELTSKRMGGA